MQNNNRLRFPGLLLLGLTLLDLSLIFLSVVLIQGQRGFAVGLGYALAVLSVVSFLPVAREWLSPSFLEIAGNEAELKWNNWLLSGRVVKADLPARKVKRLSLTLSGVETRIDPVGPLFLLASFILYPVLRPVTPAWWAPLYVINKGQLSRMLGVSTDNSLTISFPATIFGRRKLRRVVENQTAEA